MESRDISPPQADASRPSLGFPLGTALLLIVIFSLSGIFSCCYHWDKLRSLRQCFHSDAQPSASDSPSKSTLASAGLKENRGPSLPVLMPGDEVPKFIAMPCPCEPPHITVTVQNPPPKSPPFPVPLY